MDNETISVIIPAYNSSPTICETVDSVLNQTRVPDEIIIVDDCGPDDVLAALGDRIERVKYIRHDTNRGVASSRNTGFTASSGSLIAFLDGDDVYFPQFLETASRVLAEKPEVPVCFGAFHSAFEDQFSLITDRSIPENPKLTFYRPGENLTAYLYDATSPLINFGLVRRSAIKQILKDGLVFDPKIRLTPDFNYLLELFVQFNFAFIESPCGIWRLRPGSMSKDQLAMWESRVESLESVLAAASSWPVSPNCLKKLRANQHASVRYCAKILAKTGRRMEAVKVLAKELMSYPHYKTIILLLCIAFGISYRTEPQMSGDWRGSSIK